MHNIVRYCRGMKYRTLNNKNRISTKIKYRMQLNVISSKRNIKTIKRGDYLKIYDHYLMDPNDTHFLNIKDYCR